MKLLMAVAACSMLVWPVAASAAEDSGSKGSTSGPAAGTNVQPSKQPAQEGAPGKEGLPGNKNGPSAKEPSKSK